MDEEELFRQFAKQPRQSVKQPHPSNRHLVHSVEDHIDHQQMKYNPYYTPEKAHIESDNSLEMEKSLQSVTGQRVSFDSYQSGSSEEEREIANMDKTFTTGRKQNGAQKSADSEEEFEINREVCQKNTVSLRSSSGSDIDVVGKEVIGKVMERKNSNGDWNGITVLSPTASAGSFSDIQDFSCIPCDRCSIDKMRTKTPLCSGGPIDNSTPHSVITGKNVSSGSCPHHISFESLLLRSKIIDTSLWQSTESSVLSPGTFGAACEEASKIQNPITLPAATSVFNIAKCQVEQECGQTCAAPPNPPTQLTEEKAKSAEGIVLKLVEDEKDEGTVPKRMQETLDHPSDCEWCRLQKSFEENPRAHSTLDSVLEMIESAVQSKEEIIKKYAPSEEALRMLQKAESGSTGNQTNTTTAQEESTGDTGNKTSITSSTGESSNKKAIERTNWTQPHRIIILK
ncbi:inactive serine/threonine-protein kinase TEX14-like [Mobula hypostoma]|uniref:inactive serine/threonine-protein kinase TEX14-like n=1 Tax=Mobula hypostoma TaxID=723540 RepID=UPI002FC3CA51